jgi:hypothetical protein
VVSCVRVVEGFGSFGEGSELREQVLERVYWMCVVDCPVGLPVTFEQVGTPSDAAPEASWNLTKSWGVLYPEAEEHNARAN